MVIQVSESELANYEEGASLSFPNYSILKQGSKYYLIDFDTIRPFESHDVVKKLGYHPDEIIEVEKKDLEGYEVGTTIKSTNSDLMGRLVRLKEDKGLYYIKDNQFSPIPDEQIAYINFPYLTEENTSVKELQEYSRGSLVKFRDGTLMGIKGASEIFVIEKSKKRHIASEEVFEGFGYDWGNIVWTDELTGNAHTTGQPIYLPSRLAVAQESNIQVTSHVEEDIDSVIIEENGKVYTISEQDTEYIGKTFDTDINTYLVADYNTQEVLAGKNIDVIRPMASFVKVMTGYRLMKEGLKLNRFSTYNPAEHKSTYHRFRIATGEKYRNRDLMSSLLISSLNTPARILVSSVEDNEDKFISRMNKQAREWGLTNTKFTDTYGYDLGNLTTARDYLTIYTNSEKNVEIRKFLGSKKYEYTEVIDKDNMPTHRDNHSNHLVNTKGLDFEIISSKTGYLDEAGAGLVMLIKRPFDNKKFVVITMGNPEYTNRFDEPSNIAEWAIEEL